MTQHLKMRALTNDELDQVSGGNPDAIVFPGDFSMAVSDSDIYVRRTVTMFLRRVWRDGAL
jgi:hypothetical protein